VLDELRWRIITKPPISWLKLKAQLTTMTSHQASNLRIEEKTMLGETTEPRSLTSCEALAWKLLEHAKRTTIVIASHP
jgi:hypothetical protein